jgi:hypothetical protein
MKLDKGAKVKVRLHTGRVAEGIYIKPSIIEKNHLVRLPGGAVTTIGSLNGSRFVGPPCDLVPVGVSV